MPSEGGVRWPDGWSGSVPFPGGRVGGTYYLNPGSPSAPRITLTRSLGMPGAGLNAVFLRQGMTSSDTLGPGLSGNVSTILPSVSLNGTIPDNDVLRPWKSRVTTIEAGIGTPNASPALTATYTPQQIADFLTRYVFPPPSGPGGKGVFVRDSAAGAGVASRNNVFEHGYPEPSSAPPAENGGKDDKLGPNLFDTGAPRIPFSSISQSALRGLPGSMDPSGLMAPSTGGLPGLIWSHWQSDPAYHR